MKKIKNRNKYSKTNKRTIRYRFNKLCKTLIKENITTKKNAKEIRNRLIIAFTKNQEKYKKINNIYYIKKDILELFNMLSMKKYIDNCKIIMYSEDISILRKDNNITSQSWAIVEDEDNNLIIYFAKY